MKKFKCNKLVRDDVVAQLASQGIVSVMVENPDMDYYLRLKLQEESAEIAKAQTREETVAEICDVLEVLDAFLRHHNISHEEIDSIRNAKYEAKGAFEKGLVIDSVEMDDDNPAVARYLAKPDEYEEL